MARWHDFCTSGRIGEATMWLDLQPALIQFKKSQFDKVVKIACPVEACFAPFSGQNIADQYNPLSTSQLAFQRYPLESQEFRLAGTEAIRIRLPIGKERWIGWTPLSEHLSPLKQFEAPCIYVHSAHCEQMTSKPGLVVIHTLSSICIDALTQGKYRSIGRIWRSGTSLPNWRKRITYCQNESAHRLNTQGVPQLSKLVFADEELCRHRDSRRTEHSRGTRTQAPQKKKTPLGPSIRSRKRADRDSPLTGFEVKTFGKLPGRTFKPYPRIPPPVTRPVCTELFRSSPTLPGEKISVVRMASPVHLSLAASFAPSTI